jgi:hypothetical protein
VRARRARGDTGGVGKSEGEREREREREREKERKRERGRYKSCLAVLLPVLPPACPWRAMESRGSVARNGGGTKKESIHELAAGGGLLGC